MKNILNGIFFIYVSVHISERNQMCLQNISIRFLFVNNIIRKVYSIYLLSCRVFLFLRKFISYRISKPSKVLDNIIDIIRGIQVFSANCSVYRSQSHALQRKRTKWFLILKLETNL